ncbi:hypothetical protein DMH15_33025 [Streptomyces sp. WAC 06725]|uniref:hypothetical protein n=1 Tax=Streptomyces sp. WAC 06725 TaxID=2203209 RepID=UPI000F738F10|nr:hypothetical protein [Streptomyces sp. WAC 06725]RSO22585.1 hypothetical protein DMH15_33025 [Streptomyces sp. WAC 06725]
MAEVNPPSWAQAGEYPARNDRLGAISAMLCYPGFAADEAAPLRIRQGVKPSYQNYQLKVRPTPTPTMSVIVSAGYCWIDNHDLSGFGAYCCVNDADETLTIAPAGGAGQYRKDAVIASVYDSETSGSVTEWRLEVIQGAYAASAGAAQIPSTPASALILGVVSVGPGQTTVTAASISDIRNFAVAAGGILPVGSSISLPRPHPGQVMYHTDTDAFQYGRADGSVATLHRDTGWLTLPLPSGYTTFSTNSYPVQIRKVRDQVFLRGRMTRTAGTIPDQTTFAAWIPAEYRPRQSTTSYQDVTAVCGAGGTAPSGLLRCEIVGNGDFRLSGAVSSSWVGFPSTSWWAD